MNLKKAICAIVVALTLCLVFVGCSSNETQREKIDLNRYLVVETNGYNGYGTISVTLDTERLVKEHTDLLVTSETTQTVDNKTPEENAIFMFDMFTPFTLKFEEVKTLKNGDIVPIEWVKNEEGLQEVLSVFNADFTYKNVKHEVNGLADIIAVNPFENVHLETSGLNGQGKIDVGMSMAVVKVGNDNYIFAIEVLDLKESGYSNGDKVVVQLAVDESNLIPEYGISLTSKTAEVEVSGLSHYPNEETNVCDILDTTYCDIAFKEHIKNTVGEATVTYVGAAIYLNDENDKKDDLTNWQNQLVLIYHIDDGNVEGGWYQYFMPKRNVYIQYALDEDYNKVPMVIMDTMDKLSIVPDDYVSMSVYQGVSNELTFKENGKTYAGSKDLQEIIRLCERFGITNTSEYYAVKQTSDSLK